MMTEKEILRNIRKTRAKVARMKEELPKLEECIADWQDSLHTMLLQSERYKKQSAESIQDFVKSLGASKNIASRILSCFSHFGMKTVGDIVKCLSEESLSRTVGLGEKSFGFIRNGLKKRRLYLRPFGRIKSAGSSEQDSPRWNEPSQKQ